MAKKQFADLPAKTLFRMFIILLLSVLVIDIGLDVFFYFFPILAKDDTIFFNSMLLFSFLAPATYFILYRPLKRNLEHLHNKEASILKLNRGHEIILNAAAEGILGIDNNGRHTFVNLAATKLLGYTSEELKGRDYTPLWLPAETNLGFRLEKPSFNQVLTEGITLNIRETRLQRKDGSTFPVSCKITPIIEEAKITGAVITFTDISVQKRIEMEQLVRLEIANSLALKVELAELLMLIHQSFKKVIDAENCFFALYNPQSGLFHFPYFVDQFDLPPAPRSLSRSCTNYVFHSGKSIIITPEVFKHLNEQNEVELVGSPSPSWIGVPLKTSTGTIGVLVLQHYEKENIYNELDLSFLDSVGSLVANVVDRKRAENELDKSFSLISATLESTADGILVVDQKGKITNYNEKFRQLWQIPEEMLSDRSDEKVIAYVKSQLKDPESFLRKIKDVYHNESEIITDTLEFKDGKYFERYSQVQRFKGEIVGRVWSFRDITERRKAIVALSENEARLKELNATKDKFFSIIAHDLKSPFNSILGFSNLLVEQVSAHDYDGVIDYANIIQESSKKAMDLLKNLAEWARSQAGRMEFNPEYFEIGTLITEIIELSNVTALEKGITIKREIPHHITLYLDKEMIGSVIRNLISNAVKFTRPGGTILVRAEERDKHLEVSVKDNGIGIQEKDLKKLFRIDESYSLPGTNNERGTGLGLILCKEFIEMHKGRIWAESEIGTGSNFHFSIPL